MKWLLALLRRPVGTAADWQGLARCDVGVPEPPVVFLFAGLGPHARKAFELFPDEARVWRALAEMEAARARVWTRQGRVWDAGMCAGRAQAYRAAAQQVEDVLIESLELWEQYERQISE